MSDIENYGHLAEVILSGQLLKEIYSDLQSPAIKAFGTTLKDVIDFGVDGVIYPVQLISEKRKIRMAINLKHYEEELKQTDSKNHIPVQSDVALPILVNFANVSNKNIIDAFVKLLVKASNQDTANLVHPGFTKVLERLSSDEVKIIKQLNRRYSQGIRCIVDVSFFSWHQQDNTVIELASFKQKVFITEYNFEDLLFSKRLNLYMENLLSLGLLSFDEVETNEVNLDPSFKKMIEKYQKENNLYSWSEYIGYYNEVHEQRKIKRGMLSFTHYGSLFVKACILPNY